jgi:hypothetical protein
VRRERERERGEGTCVDFTAGGPPAVGVVDGQHPYCGPEPVAFGQLGTHVDASVGDRGVVERDETGRGDGWDDGALCGGGDGLAGGGVDRVGRDAGGRVDVGHVAGRQGEVGAWRENGEVVVVRFGRGRYRQRFGLGRER